MPFIDQTAKRSFLQTATPDMNIPTPDFSETFGAAVGLTIDENLSISMNLNREGFNERKRLTESLLDEGKVNRDRYMDARGRFDYNRLSLDMPDSGIKSDAQLSQERSEMLARRRAYAEDVLDRGNGMAQFLGMANAYMLDPISIATMPIALPSTAAKSLSIAGRALLTARNAAAIEAATELAIQPFVYAHKHDIDSPYTFKDALTNIAGAAIGAGAIGGVTGGLSGYLRKVRSSVEELGDVSPEVETALENLARMQESLDVSRAERITPDTILGDYDRLIQGEYKSFTEAANQSVRKLEKEIAGIKSESQTITQFVQRKGGLNRELIEAEGIDPASFKFQGGKPFFRKGAGMTLDDLAESLNEINFKNKLWTANDALDLVDGITRGEDTLMDLDSAAKVDYLENQLDQLSAKGDEAYFESVYKGAREDDIQADIDFLEELEVQRQKSGAPQTTPDQYELAPQQKAASGTIGQRERFIIDEAGLGDDFDMDMQKFREVENPQIVQGDELVSANEFMKSIDDELEGIDSVLTCAYG